MKTVRFHAIGSPEVLGAMTWTNPNLDQGRFLVEVHIAGRG